MPEQHTYAPDWIVRRVEDHGPNRYWRYVVEGTNMNFAPEHPDRSFRWRVHENPAAWWRYDLTNAEHVVVEAAADAA